MICHRFYPGGNAGYSKFFQNLKHQDLILQLQVVNCMIKISQGLLLVVFVRIIQIDLQVAFARNIHKWLGRFIQYTTRTIHKLSGLFTSGKDNSQAAREIHQWPGRFTSRQEDSQVARKIHNWLGRFTQYTNRKIHKWSARFTSG